MNVFVLVFVSGFSIGILGSFHCIGMCGPLALALPINNYSGFKKFLAILLYNSGRAITYAFMGMLFGVIGQTFSLFKLQQYLSIGAGVFILTVLLLSLSGKFNASAPGRFANNIKTKLGNLLRSEKGTLSYLSVGILNGFLPCGLVYIAVAAAVATGTILKSSLLMFAFGLGTMPLMALTMVLGKFISVQFRTRLNKATPYFIAVVAILLIVRGMNLGIPYLSPTHDKHHVNCCEE